ncbi:bacillithiol biosynthesis deacetylase BshB1 [Crocinitomicaceae bacterium]|nr:bacillithiol biosynthesis deacetylase BshB1 [Crocinitomicaceae bacterium]
MKLDILAFGAHPDDVEISVGASLLKYSDEGKSIGIIDLTEGELGTRGSIEQRYKESEKASQMLGLKVRSNLNLGDGTFEVSNENKIKIIEQIRLYQPEIVLANSLNDRHPDHGKGAKLVADACFLSGLDKIKTEHEGIPQIKFRPRLLLHYIQDYYLTPDFILDVSSHGAEKVNLVKCYRSQFYDPNSKEMDTPISGKEFFEFLEGRMLTYGRELGVKYGEGYNINRTLGTSDLFTLK